MKHIKKFELSDNDIKINEDDTFGVINIKIDGDGRYKNKIVNDIRQIMAKYIGEKHLFVDSKEINPHAGFPGVSIT